MEFTKEKIEALKAAHPEGIYLLKDEDGNQCILHEPSRNDYSYILACKDEVKMNELLINQLWVDGDEIIKTNFKTTIAFAKMAAGTLFQMKEVELKKL